MTQGRPTEQSTYWSTPLHALLTKLGTTDTGLSEAEAAARLQTYGHNCLTSGHASPLWQAVGSQLRNPLSWLLVFAALVGASVGETTDAVILVTILMLGSLTSIVQESHAGRALQRLRDRVALQSRVVRDGQETDVLATTVVPGDILLLAAGTMISADAVLLQARDLYVGEAALTGEPFAVEKRPGEVGASSALGERCNVVHMGTNVRSGTGRAVVVETGTRTVFGAIAGRLALRPPETEFQLGLRRFGYLLLSMMIVLVFLVFAASALRHHPPVDALLFAVALAVGLAPEMLPAVLATMLARGARRMAERGVLVRRLEAMENLGNMDVLCTDKTGTLTEGEIQLEAATNADGEASDRVLSLAFWNAKLQAGLPNPLDRAIVSTCPGGALALPSKSDEIPFDFARKRLSVLVESPGHEPLLVTKGAADSVLSVCNAVRAAGRTVSALDAPTRARLESRVAALSRGGIRVIAVATRQWPRDESIDRRAEHDLVLEGFVTFRDPPKPEVEKAIGHLRSLGIRVKIISGDHRGVVAHLAGQVGLHAREVLCGKEIATLRDDALWHLAERCDLFAEVDPIQKERILVALKKTGHVVGFMGDGINDAPAIRAADVGISVDGAADVAREAADFVLLQRDLDTICAGVEEGRTTFANTLKYVLTTESANLGNMLSMAAATLFLPFLPLLAHQVLLNNLLSDIPSTTLAGDRVDRDMVCKPQHWNMGFIRRFMLLFGLISAAFDGVTFLILTQLFHATPEVFRTAWFAESLLTELLVLLVLRTRGRFWTSRPHPALLGSTLLVLGLTFALPLSPVRDIFGFTELPGVIWLSVVVITVSYALTIEVVKSPLLSYLDRKAAQSERRGRRPSGPHPWWPR
ncbi:MAG: magnesium-translocating P-type ATPase [Polyangiales bacterium]